MAQLVIHVRGRYDGRALRLARVLLPQRADRHVERVAGFLADRARARAHVITGRMRAAVTVEKISQGRWRVFVDPAQAPYAWWENYGTRHRAGHPFWSQAVAETRARLDAGQFR